MTQRFTETDRVVEARDGYTLAATAFVPEQPKAAVLISSGTGFPQQLYRRMARFGAENGFACLTYDYRGIAGSAPEQMAGFKADIVDWGRLDFAAALDAAEALAAGTPLYTIGHSVGAHLIGFADNALKARAHAFITAGTGYWGAHELPYRPLAMVFWLLYGPACLAVKNYIPAGGLWGGTALPRDVYTQWRQWAFKPDYFGAYLEQLEPHLFAEITAPIRDWTFADDTLCSRRSADDLLKLYPSAPSDQHRLAPSEVGAKQVDHHGAFKQDAAGFWPIVFDWLSSTSSPA